MIAAIFAAALVCTSPHIADGDTLTCSKKVVRIYGVNAPEIAHPGLHIAQEPGGPEAKARMQELTTGQQVTCTKAGNQHDRYHRTVGRCGTVATPDLGAELLREGRACRWAKYDRAMLYVGIGRDCDGRGK